jgi:hypothetical protein
MFEPPPPPPPVVSTGIPDTVREVATLIVPIARGSDTPAPTATGTPDIVSVSAKTPEGAVIVPLVSRFALYCAISMWAPAIHIG